MEQQRITQLSDREVALVLTYVTEELQADAGPPAAADEAEARELLAQFLEAAGEARGITPADLVPDDAASDVGRRLIATLAADESTAETTRDLVEEPPEDTQMAIELAIGAAVVLGALITWLQTKVDLHVERKDGKTEFTFDLTKESSDPETIKEVASTVAKLIPGL